MKRINSSRFTVGIALGIMAGAIIWYWQKSTSAEDGALVLLDRLAAAESKLRELRIELKKQDGNVQREDGAAEKSVDLQTVRGVGPVFEKRLHASGITTVGHLANVDAEALSMALRTNVGRAKTIIAEASDMIS